MNFPGFIYLEHKGILNVYVWAKMCVFAHKCVFAHNLEKSDCVFLPPMFYLNNYFE